MAYDPFRHDRRSIRLPGYDYAAPGAYFITICAQHHECVFGGVVEGEVSLNEYGEIVRKEWERSVGLRPTLALDAFVVMPSHLHGIVTLVDDRSVGAHSCAPLLPRIAPLQHAAPPATPLQRRARSVSSFVAQFKATTTRRINALRETTGTPVWQRNYYEHIVRDEEDLERIRAYINEDPRRWPEDEYHPAPT